MTKGEAWELACKVRDALSPETQQRLKAVHIVPRLHQGMLTLRIFTVNRTAPDPDPFIFTADELL